MVASAAEQRSQRVRDLELLLRDVVMTAGISFERHRVSRVIRRATLLCRAAHAAYRRIGATTPRRRRRPGDRLPRHPEVHPELAGNSRNRTDPKLMLLTELLEQIHSGLPIHSELPGKAENTLGLRDGSWAKICQHDWAEVR